MMMDKGIVGWGDIVPETRELLMMEKDVFDGSYDRQWPMAGSKLSVELISQSARALKFYLDIIENKRATTLIVGLAPDRKCTMQHRRSDRPLLRADYATNAEMLRHRNPDGSMIVGPHVHLDVGNEGIHWAFPLAAQSVVVPEQDGVPALFWAFQEACRITKLLRVEQSLGV